MNVSPTLRPLLRDILGAQADDIPEELIQLVARTVSEVKYLDTILGEASPSAALQVSRYKLN